MTNSSNGAAPASIQFVTSKKCLRSPTALHALSKTPLQLVDPSFGWSTTLNEKWRFFEVAFALSFCSVRHIEEWGSMVLNTFRRVARKQLQQEAAGKSCLESLQGWLGKGMVHGRLRRGLVMNFFFFVAAGFGARSNYVSNFAS